MNGVHATRSAWRLRHGWHASSDAAALALCREVLEGAGLVLLDTAPNEGADAAKMHGMELVAARQAGQPVLLDLSATAQAQGWALRLPSTLRHYMVDGRCWHGIPLGIHRANAAWVNAGLCERIGQPEPADPAAWLSWLAIARAQVRAPLAVGGDALQVGLLFESAVLALGGAQRYRRAFEALDGTVWQESAMLEALDLLMALRAFASDDHLALPWGAQIERVQRGEAAVAVMGDWVRAIPAHGLVEWAVPGTKGHFVAIHDLFVPFAGAPAADGERAAKVLTDAGFQRRFAQRKGCMPALVDAWAGVDPVRASLLALPDAVLPSLTLDQCCLPPRRQALLAVVSAHFVQRRGAAECAAALAQACHH